MEKIVCTLIRYLFTALGATEAAAADDTVAKIASGLVALASVLWGLYEARRHAALAKKSGEGTDSGTPSAPGGGLAALLFLTLAAGAILAPLSGCASASDKPADRAVVAAPILEGAVRLAVPAILANNPELEDAFSAASQTAAAVLSSAAPTAEGFASALRAAFPKLTQADAARMGVILESAWKSAAAARANEAPEAAAARGKNAASLLAQALARGLAEGVADYRTQSR